MEEKIKRTRSVQVRLSQEEFDYLEQKFRLSGYKSKSEFMRIAFFETLIVKFNADELQEMLRIGRSKAYQLLRSGSIKAFHNGRVWMIPKKSVIEFVLGQCG